MPDKRKLIILSTLSLIVIFPPFRNESLFPFPTKVVYYK